MDPDVRHLLTVTRHKVKSARRELSMLARLLAELEDRFPELENDGYPQGGDHDGTTDEDA